MPSPFRPGRGIPLRLLVTPLILLLLAGTVGLTGWLLIRNGLEAADEITVELSREVGRRVEDYLASYLGEAHLVNDLNADAVLQGELRDWGSDSLSRHFWHQLQRFEHLSFVFLGTRHGGAAGAGRVGDRITVDTTDVDERGLVAGTRREFVALPGGGRGRELPSVEGFDARERPWFSKARERGGPVWSEVYRFARDENVLAIAASRPVYEPSGELWGVLGVDLELSEIGRYLRTISDPGEVYVFEPDGSLIATSSDASPAAPGGEPSGNLRPPRDSLRRAKAWEVGDPALRRMVRQGYDVITELVASGEWSRRGERVDRRDDRTSFAIDLNPGGFFLNRDRHLVTLDGHVDPRGLDWRIVTIIPQDIFLSGITPATQQTILACVVALVLAMILGFWVSRWIARPVEQLTGATRALSAGEWKVHVGAGQVRELNELGAAFNRMGGELKSSFEELEERVSERTAELEVATETAIAANRAKTEFLATVSHEIRTPLSTILGYVDLLRDGYEDGERADAHLRTIRDSGAHLNHLVGDLLDVGRIEAGRLELDPTPCDLGDLVAQLRSMFAARAAERRLTLEIETHDRLPWRFAADTVRIRQVVSNLLSNAIRYTERGSVRLTVLADSAPDGERATLVFAVADTGVGIRQEDQPKIFERFTQVDPSLLRRNAGFGLGLWITRQLTDRMGGRIDFESVEGEGSTFVARIPVTDCSDWGVREVERTSNQDEPAAPRLVGHVLVAEDSAALRDLCRHRLERWGLSCTIVEDGRAALDRFDDASNAFDLILMDWQMPHVDGLEATRALRGRGVKVPILALTAAAMHGDRDRCLAAGCDRYLVKPIDFRSLYRALAEYLPRASEPDVRGTEEDTEEAIERLSRRYLDRLPDSLDELEQALARQDWGEVRARVHKLVGTSGSFGLSEFLSVAERLEVTVEQQQVELAGRQIAELRRCVEQGRGVGEERV